MVSTPIAKSSFIQISFRWYIPKNPDPFIGNAKQKIGLKRLDPGFLPLERFSPHRFPIGTIDLGHSFQVLWSKNGVLERPAYQILNPRHLT